MPYTHQFIWVSSKWIQHIYYAIIFFPEHALVQNHKMGRVDSLLEVVKKYQTLTGNNFYEYFSYVLPFISKWLEPKNMHHHTCIASWFLFLAFPYREFHHAPMPNVKRRKNDIMRQEWVTALQQHSPTTHMRLLKLGMTRRQIISFLKGGRFFSFLF